ncbi:hypothetical protein AAG570_006986 [Ranatra chinensis]|uniref:Uncharacterized protein n=1 Tax=Ranatra chinensis TaxID=642074 RepID=A0ABD0ZIZ2_9HEMI
MFYKNKKQETTEIEILREYLKYAEAKGQIRGAELVRGRKRAVRVSVSIAARFLPTTRGGGLVQRWQCGLLVSEVVVQTAHRDIRTYGQADSVFSVMECRLTEWALVFPLKAGLFSLRSGASWSVEVAPERPLLRRGSSLTQLHILDESTKPVPPVMLGGSLGHLCRGDDRLHYTTHFPGLCPAPSSELEESARWSFITPLSAAPMCRVDSNFSSCLFRLLIRRECDLSFPGGVHSRVGTIALECPSMGSDCSALIPPEALPPAVGNRRTKALVNSKESCIAGFIVNREVFRVETCERVRSVHVEGWWVVSMSICVGRCLSILGCAVVRCCDDGLVSAGQAVAGSGSFGDLMNLKRYYGAQTSADNLMARTVPLSTVGPPLFSATLPPTASQRAERLSKLISQHRKTSTAFTTTFVCYSIRIAYLKEHFEATGVDWLVYLIGPDYPGLPSVEAALPRKFMLDDPARVGAPLAEGSGTAGRGHRWQRGAARPGGGTAAEGSGTAGRGHCWQRGAARPGGGTAGRGERHGRAGAPLAEGSGTAGRGHRWQRGAARPGGGTAGRGERHGRAGAPLAEGSGTAGRGHRWQRGAARPGGGTAGRGERHGRAGAPLAEGSGTAGRGHRWQRGAARPGGGTAGRGERHGRAGAPLAEGSGTAGRGHRWQRGAARPGGGTAGRGERHGRAGAPLAEGSGTAGRGHRWQRGAARPGGGTAGKGAALRIILNAR